MDAGCEPLRVWNRLEPRPRQVELDRVLEAQVHDPLWFITRAWALGETKAEDTGSAVLATVARRAFPVGQVRTGAVTQPYDATEAPMEPLVERLPVAFGASARASAASHLMTLLVERLATAGAPDDLPDAVRTALLDAFPLERLELDPDDPAHALSVARRRSTARADRMLRALAGRSFDGVAFAQSVPAAATWADMPGALALVVPSEHADTVLNAVREFRSWFADLWSVPPVGAAVDGAWNAAKLEYDYGCTVARGMGVHLTGAPSPSGRLDWYSFDLESGPDAPPDAADAPWEVTSAIPTPAQFAGMPSPRWWQLEDGAVSLSGLRADSGDLAKLLVTDFALVYGNNWFVLPYEQRLGTLCEVAGIVVTDVFGLRTLVEAATGAAGGDWDAWDMFSLSPRRAGPVPALGQHLFLPPVAPSVVEAAPAEEVVLLRDEMSNMVWAVETRVPDGSGGSRDGAAAAREFAAALAVLEQAHNGLGSGTEGAADEPALTYRLATTMPGNWIPYLPVHRPSSTHEIRLQRTSMPRFFPAGSPRVRPVTSILRTGMADPAARSGRFPEVLEDGDAQASPSFVNEEEVPRSGIVVRGGVQRARWTDGRIVMWHGRRASAGRGEGSSGLRFDALESDDRP